DRVPRRTAGRAARADRAPRRSSTAAPDRAAVPLYARHRSRAGRHARRRARPRDRGAVTLPFSPEGVASLVADNRVLICCGSGGVGKTRIAAVLALEGARQGRNTCVITIDPAKRLADALGLEHLSDTPSDIDRTRWDDDGTAKPDGALSALMLDTKSTFDHL